MQHRCHPRACRVPHPHLTCGVTARQPPARHHYQGRHLLCMPAQLPRRWHVAPTRAAGGQHGGGKRRVSAVQRTQCGHVVQRGAGRHAGAACNMQLPQAGRQAAHQRVADVGAAYIQQPQRRQGRQPRGRRKVTAHTNVEDHERRWHAQQRCIGNGAAGHIERLQREQMPKRDCSPQPLAGCRVHLHNARRQGRQRGRLQVIIPNGTQHPELRQMRK